MTEQETKCLQEWELFLRNISQFVQVGKKNGIKFIVRTNEQSGHHRPHLHVETADASMSVAIDDGEILAYSGVISPAQKKMATKWIKENHGFVVKKWNEFSNGIEIQVD